MPSVVAAAVEPTPSAEPADPLTAVIGLVAAPEGSNFEAMAEPW
jgi:hypothetical protein